MRIMHHLTRAGNITPEDDSRCVCQPHHATNLPRVADCPGAIVSGRLQIATMAGVESAAALDQRERDLLEELEELRQQRTRPWTDIERRRAREMLLRLRERGSLP